MLTLGRRCLPPGFFIFDLSIPTIAMIVQWVGFLDDVAAFVRHFDSICK
jgi:hypothetical protein